MKPKPLSELVLSVLHEFDAPLASAIAARLMEPEANVRAAYDTLEASGRAKIVRRGRGLHLLPIDSPVRVCPVCRAEMGKRQRGRTCSKSCGMRVAWTKRDRARQGEVLRENHRRYPEKMHTGLVHRRGSAVAMFVGQRNREDWADPVHKMKRVLSMEAAWRGPAGQPRKAKARAKKLSLWSDPEWKQKAVEAMRTGRRGRFQRAAIRLVAEGATDEEIAFRTGRTMEQTKTLLRRLFKAGKINRAPVDGRKMRPVRPKRTARTATTASSATTAASA